jgi:hypothetical protein
MTFRYLNTAETAWSPGDPLPSADPDRVLALLLGLPTSRKSKLSHEDSRRAYAIIVDHLLDLTPPLERRDAVVELAEKLTTGFSEVIQDILAGCR